MSSFVYTCVRAHHTINLAPVTICMKSYLNSVTGAKKNRKRDYVTKGA